MRTHNFFSFLAFWTIIIISQITKADSTVNTSVLVPETLEDEFGNFADANSTIVFGPLLDNGGNSTDIDCSKCVGDDGVRPYLDMAQGFSHFVVPGEYQYKWVQRAKDGEFDEYQEAAQDHIGIVICLAIGVVFLLVFPIVGMCVCCCRCCCGKCGGNRKTDGNIKESCHRTCYMFSLAILSVFVGVGGILVLATNNSVSDGIDSFHKDMPDNLDSVLDYMKDAVEVLKDITTNDYNFTTDVIFRDLDNIGYIMGGDIKENLERQINLDNVGQTVTDIETALTNLLNVIPNINEQITNVTNDINAYVAAMTQVENDFTTAVSGSTSPGLNNTIDSDEIPALGGETELEEVKNASLTNLLNEALEEVDDIPEKVHNNSQTSVADLKQSINDFSSDVTNITDDLDIDKEIDRESIKDDVNTYTEKAVTYDKYRWYAGLAIGIIILVVTLLFVLGLLLGFCGGSGSVPPHRRSCCSNCGGNLLLAASGIFFIFGALIMLITLILFATGTLTEDYGCVALKDPAIIDRLIDDYDLLGETDGSGNYLGDRILDDPDKNLTLTEILNNCEQNQAIYKALRINESNLINITDILNYKDDFSVEEHVSSINVDFGDIKLLTPDLQNNIKKLNDSIQYNISKYENELNQDPTKSATDFQNELRADLSSVSPSLQTIYTSTINAIQTVLDVEGVQLSKSSSALKESIAELDAILHPVGEPSLSEDITLLETQLQDIDDNIEMYGNQSLNDGIDAFSDRLFRTTDTFIDYLLDALDNDIGKCYPIYDFYKTLLKDNLCGTLIDSVNGFWFALGWSIFFLMPSLIIAIKLSSHFRTMKLVESDFKIIPDSNGPPSYMKSNKVTPMQNHRHRRKIVW